MGFGSAQHGPPERVFQMTLGLSFFFEAVGVGKALFSGLHSFLQPTLQSFAEFLLHLFLNLIFRFHHFILPMGGGGFLVHRFYLLLT